MIKIFPNYIKLVDFPLGAEVFLLNKDESETLTVSFYAGSSAYEPMEFHISTSDKDRMIKSKTLKLNVDIFTTESNIKLHISKKSPRAFLKASALGGLRRPEDGKKCAIPSLHRDSSVAILARGIRIVAGCFVR